MLSRLCPRVRGAFWPWLNGNVSLAQLTRELEEMKDKGMSGADIWDVKAMSDPDQAWLKLAPTSETDLEFFLCGLLLSSLSFGSPLLGNPRWLNQPGRDFTPRSGISLT